MGRKWLWIGTISLIQVVLSHFAFAPDRIFILAWLMPLPLFYLADRLPLKDRIRAGLLLGLLSCIVAFHWVIYLMKEFGGIPYFLGVFIFIPYSLLLNLKLPLFLTLAGTLRRPTLRFLPRWIFLPFLAVLCDYLTPQIFPWYWGNLIAGDPYLSQWAEAGGVYLLTFFVFLGSYALYRILWLIWRSGRRLKRLQQILIRRRALLTRTIIFMVFFVFLYTAGAVRYHFIEELQARLPVLRTAILQPNAPLEKAGEQKVTPAVIETLMQETIPRLAHEAHLKAGPIDLFVLPESAVPYYSTQRGILTESSGMYSATFEMMAQKIAYFYNADVFLNDLGLRMGQFPSGEDRLESTNSAALFGRDGRNQKRYDKLKLLAFGEYIPGSWLLETTGLIDIVPDTLRYNRFYPGKSADLMPYSRRAQDGLETEWKESPDSPQEFLKLFEKQGRSFQVAGYFLPLICYEVIIPEHLQQYYAAGIPDFLVNVTQDGWYGKTIETYQHYELGRLRAIEHRRSLVRATNSGSSGFVDLLGNYVKPLYGPVFSGQEEEAVQVYDVPLHRGEPTLYARYGNRWIFVLSSFYVLAGFLLYYRKKSGRSGKKIGPQKVK
ncbi:MAG: hypothetical protein HS115_10865 [Spirochaetales bacterium]|nr:hypothetical protein [Spirochaetales bacterium]